MRSLHTCQRFQGRWANQPRNWEGFDLGLPPAAEKTRTWATQVQDRRIVAKLQQEAALPLKQVVEEPKLPAISDSFNEEKAVVLQPKVTTTSSPDPYIWHLSFLI